MNKRIIVPTLVLLALAAGGTWYWQHGGTTERPPDQLTLYGNIDVRLVNLAFDAQGRIAEMSAAEGARVESEDVLARLDSRRLELARDAAVAKAATQRERVRELEAGTRPEEIRKLEAQLAAARTQTANLRRSYRRIHDLEMKDLVSPQQSEDAHTAAEAAEENARALEAALALARAGAREEEIAAAKATQAALEAEAALAARNLDDAVLRAPAGGIVQSRILEPGDLASPQRPVYTLALTEPLWARVYLSESTLGRVRPGMPARISSDSFPDRAYRGWVGYISPSAEFTPKSVQTEETRTDLVYQARVFVCDPEGGLRLGMPVTVHLDLDAQPLSQPGCAGEEGR
jgi:HlyD family secretion protein